MGKDGPAKLQDATVRLLGHHVRKANAHCPPPFARAAVERVRARELPRERKQKRERKGAPRSSLWRRERKRAAAALAGLADSLTLEAEWTLVCQALKIRPDLVSRVKTQLEELDVIADNEVVEGMPTRPPWHTISAELERAGAAPPLEACPPPTVQDRVDRSKGRLAYTLSRAVAKAQSALQHGRLRGRSAARGRCSKPGRPGRGNLEALLRFEVDAWEDLERTEEEWHWDCIAAAPVLSSVARTCCECGQRAPGGHCEDSEVEGAQRASSDRYSRDEPGAKVPPTPTLMADSGALSAVALAHVRPRRPSGPRRGPPRPQPRQPPESPPRPCGQAAAVFEEVLGVAGGGRIGEELLTPRGQVAAAFEEVLDVGGGGRIREELLTRVLLSLGLEFTEEQASMLVSAAGVKDSGGVDYAEFVNWLMAPS